MQQTTEALQQLDARHHLHPFTDTVELHAQGVRIIAKGEGVYITDSTGRRCLDAMSGLWCVNIGYGRREIAEAAARQMNEIPYYNTLFHTTTPPAIELAQQLGEVAPPGLDRAFFTTSGSEAVDSAYRIVRHYWNTVGQPERTLIISRENAYHGTTVAGAGIGGMEAMHRQGGDAFSAVRHAPQPYWYGEGLQSDPAAFGIERARAVEDLIEEAGPERVAAFIGEPVQGAGGVVIPPPTYWPEIQRICRERDILLIVDEVICGFGRTGKWFGTQAFGLEPDLMTVAKGLSSGYLPIGGVLVGDRVADVISTGGGEFAHGHTYSGHPVCCAAAIENIRILREEGIVERAEREVIPAFRERWQRLAEHPLVGEARSFGLLAALELTPDRAVRAPFPGEAGRAGRVCRETCVENGIVMRAVRDTMVAAPPLVISEAELDELAEKAWTSLDRTADALRKEGLL